jgi:hypothetical protein
VESDDSADRCRDAAALQEGVTVGTQYVQHKSGTGEKWKVYDESYLNWFCLPLKIGEEGRHYLPKSEYVEVPAPEVWTDVTAECVTCNSLSTPHGSVLEDKSFVIARIERGYRLRKVPICTGNGPGHEPTKQWAFIVEQRKAQP